MKAKKIFKGFITIILFVVQLISFCFFSYSLFLYKGVENFYRYYGILILFYLLILMTYLLLRGIKKKKTTGFAIAAIITLIIIGVECGGYYYLNKIYLTKVLKNN